MYVFGVKFSSQASLVVFWTDFPGGRCGGPPSSGGTHPRGSLLIKNLKTYNQRGALEHTLFGPFRRLVLGCINADFCVQGLIFQHFSSSTFFPLHHSRFLWFFKPSHHFLQNLANFCGFSQKRADFANFLQILTDFFRNFAQFLQFCNEWCQDCYLLENSEKICRKFAEILLQIFRKSVWKKSNL